MKRFLIQVFPALLIVLSFQSCKKEGCMDIDAENYNSEAKKDDGSCTYIADKYIGNYTIEQDCYYGGESTYPLEIVAGVSASKVVIRNLDDNVDVIATIKDGELEFSEDKAGITYEGSGYLIGDNQLNINLEICETFYYPCSDPESCTLVGTK